MNCYPRTGTWHRISAILIGVCTLLVFSGCAASKNMLAGIFGNPAGRTTEPGTVINDSRTGMGSDTTYQLARHFQKQGKHRLAVAELLKVVRTDPDHANAYNALGVSYDRLREFDLAAAAYREALRIDPALAYVYNNIGYSHLLQSRLEEAARAFETAVSLDSDTSRYRNNLALAHARLGKNQPALAAPGLPENSTHEVSAPADDIRYTIQLGVFYDLDKALASVRHALETGLDSPYITRVDRAGPYKPYYRVRAGKYPDKTRAEHLASDIRTQTPVPAYVTQVTGTPKDTDTVAQHGDDTADMQARPVIIQSNADIEILNGNGVRHMARGFQQYLTAQGVPVRRIANASHFFHTRTVIYYSPGYYGQARQILDQLHNIDAAGKMVKSGKLNTSIRIVLGRDVVPVAGKLGQNT